MAYPAVNTAFDKAGAGLDVRVLPGGKSSANTRNSVREITPWWQHGVLVAAVSVSNGL